MTTLELGIGRYGDRLDDDRRAWKFERRRQRIHNLAWWLDSAFRIPGTRVRFGLDSVVGLVPGIGDLATNLVAVYLILEARRLGVPVSALLRMARNVAVDAVVGAIPLLGDLADVAWKANRRNLAIVEDHLRRHGGPPVIDGVARRAS